MNIRSAIVGLTIILVTFTAVAIPNLALGITIKEEEEMGREFLKIIQKRFEFIHDPTIQTYVEGIGRKILAVMPPQPFEYHFYVVKEDVYNAFAIPAGHVFIHSGLLAAMESEEELAGILAHEIAHVYCRHISQRIDASKKINMATLAGVAAGIFLGVGGDATASSALTFGSIAAGRATALAYSRENEIQADQLGLEYLVKAGYNGRGLMEILKKIRSKQWYGSDQVPGYLSTHPASEHRIAYVDSWLSSRQTAPKTKNRLPFQRMHIRLVAHYSDETIAVQEFKNATRDDPSNPMGHYGYALALARGGEYTQAIAHIKKALEHRAFDPFILQDLGRIYFLNGQYEEAIKTLENTVGMIPDSVESLFFLGRSKLVLGRYQEAVDDLRLAVGKPNGHRQTYLFLGEAYGKLGNMAEAHYYLGRHYEKNRHLKNAIFHLEKALALARTATRKTHIQDLLQRLKKQKKKERRKKQHEESQKR